MLPTVPGIDDVEGPVTLVEPLLDEGEKHPVLLLFAVEEGTYMPGAVEDRTRQAYLLWAAHRTSPFCQPQPLLASRFLVGNNPPTINLSQRTREREPVGMMPRRAPRLRIECQTASPRVQVVTRVFSLDWTDRSTGWTM